MASLTKGSAILLVASFIFAFSSGQLLPGKNIGNTVPLTVNYPADVAVPIAFTSQNYNGPYDPLDPQGLFAAARRLAAVTGQKHVETVKSYIPPDLGRLVKRELVKVAVNEGKRFAFSHPKETTELIGIATKAKILFDTASKKINNAEKLGMKQIPQRFI